MKRIERWLYVTGAPRSGTTFVGRVLSLPLPVAYIHEPFNPQVGIPGVDVRYLYARRGLPAAARVDAWVEQIRSWRFELRTLHTRRDGVLRRLGKRLAGGRGPFHLRLARMNPFVRYAVVKDPVGCLLTGHLVREHGFVAVPMIRHPVAFVASVKRLGWDLRPELAPLLSQPGLLDDHFGGEAPAQHATTPDEVAAVLWRVLNRVLLAQAAECGVPVIRHEDLSRNPLEAFHSLYATLGLPWSRRVERRIRALIRPGNRVETRGDRGHDFARDSAKLLELRLGQLSPAERARVWEITRDVAEGFYTEDGVAVSAPAVTLR